MIVLTQSHLQSSAHYFAHLPTPSVPYCSVSFPYACSVPCSYLCPTQDVASLPSVLCQILATFTRRVSKKQPFFSHYDADGLTEAMTLGSCVGKERSKDTRLKGKGDISVYVCLLVSIYVCICACFSVYLCTYLYVLCVYVYLLMCICVYECVSMCLSASVSLCLCTCLCVFLYLFLSTLMCLCRCVCVCVCIHEFI